jgi:hypothetical protein
MRQSTWASGINPLLTCETFLEMDSHSGWSFFDSVTLSKKDQRPLILASFFPLLTLFLLGFHF